MSRTVTGDRFGAWLIKCNPGVTDVTGVLRHEVPPADGWCVNRSYRLDLVEEGQRVLFWVTGTAGATPEPGLWGHGVVTGAVEHTGAKPRLPLRLEVWDSPVGRAELRADARLAGMEVFRQPQMGNPLHVTGEELAALAEHGVPLGP
jgi:hypothetical protein